MVLYRTSLLPITGLGESSFFRLSRIGSSSISPFSHSVPDSLTQPLHQWSKGQRYFCARDKSGSCLGKGLTEGRSSLGQHQIVRDFSVKMVVFRELGWGAAFPALALSLTLSPLHRGGDVTGWEESFRWAS